ncbi:hypothetical protein PAXINDRAFT_6745 [Paxillus involutus ATCC 200175]|nr:hypothetical protein PAXINDRAFT_6745 [Paxillus involutus ATCC 200175]
MRSDAAPPVLVLRNRQKSERAKLACQNCRRDNKKFFSVTTNDLVLDVWLGEKIVSMLVADQSLSSFVAKAVGTRTASVRTLDLASNVLNKGKRIDGECPHRPGTEPDASDGDGNGDGTHDQERLPTEEMTGVHHPYITTHPPSVIPPHPSQVGMAPSLFPSHIYGPSPYHILAAQPPSTTGQCSSDPQPVGYPRAAYYPVIDPQIDIPQPNISSERYDPSSGPLAPSSSS